MLLIELKELCKVEKLALSGLWPKIARGIAAWANSGLKHQVECNRRKGFHASIGVLELKFLDQLTQLFAVIVVDLSWLDLHWLKVLDVALPALGFPHTPLPQHRLA